MNFFVNGNSKKSSNLLFMKADISLQWRTPHQGISFFILMGSVHSQFTMKLIQPSVLNFLSLRLLSISIVNIQKENSLSYIKLINDVQYTCEI